MIIIWDKLGGGKESVAGDLLGLSRFCSERYSYKIQVQACTYERRNFDLVW